MAAHAVRRLPWRRVRAVGHHVRLLRRGREPLGMANRHGLRPLPRGVAQGEDVRSARQPGQGLSLRRAEVPESHCGPVRQQVDLRRRHPWRLPQEHIVALPLRLCVRREEVQRHERPVPERAESTDIVVGRLHGLPHLRRLRRPVRRDRRGADDELDGHLRLDLQLQRGGQVVVQPWRQAHRRDLLGHVLRGQSGGHRHDDHVGLDKADRPPVGQRVAHGHNLEGRRGPGARRRGGDERRDTAAGHGFPRAHPAGCDRWHREHRRGRVLRGVCEATRHDAAVPSLEPPTVYLYGFPRR
mmetsp:Transcript_49537/g.142572  ORF Transcript_49537/g.142572 Transcript_49537/m.142572 type:complete len:298 (-) Transcript_49537:99-992(-)